MNTSFARWRALVPVLIALVVPALSPAVARAGTYDITSCNPDGTAAGWSSYGGPAFQSGIVCPFNGDLTSRGFGVANAPNSGVIGTSGAGLMFRAPAGTSLVGIGSGLRMQRWDGAYWLGLITASGQNLFGFWANDGNGATAGAYTPSRWFNLSRESDVHLEVGCSGLCDTAWMAPAGFRAWAQLFDPITIRIEDNGAPTETLTGGPLLTSAYATGTQPLSYSATDASGIRASRLWVDGSKLRDDARSCNFEQPVPCGNVGGASYSVDTSTLADGAHTVKVETVDSAGNVAAQSRAISVDNHAPAAPAVSVAGGEGWRSTNSFAVNWTTPGGQVAPVVKARYQICRADQPDACQPAGVQTGPDISALSGLTVPGDGDYTLTVWLEDAAGNANVTNASAPVHLRYDSAAPAQVGDLHVAGGEDWRSANSFDLSWNNPAGQLSPVTSAHYRLCDEHGSCTTGLRSGTAGMHTLDGLTVPGPGTYELALWVGDEAGNAEQANASTAVTLRFDDTDPGQAEPVPSSGWLKAADVANGYDELVRGSVSPPSGLAGFAVTIDGSEPGTTPDTGPDGVLHIADMPEGRVVVSARAISNSGVASGSVGIAVLLVDKSAPEVSLAGAPDPHEWQPRAVVLDMTAVDQAGLSGTDGGQITYSLDGGAARSVTGASARVTVSDDGEHTVAYRAADTAGNVSVQREVSFKLDTTPPGAASLGDPGRWLNASDADDYEQPAAVAEPSLSGMAGYSVTTDGSFPDETVDATTGHFRLGSLGEGTTVVRARAVSGSGLASERAAAVSLRVDRTAPEVKLHSQADPERWQRGAVHVSLEGADALSGMDGGRLEYTVDGDDGVVVPGASAEFDVSGDGRHVIRYRGVDSAGNRSDEKAASFAIDGAKPGAAAPSSSDGWVTEPGPYGVWIALRDGELVPQSGLGGFSVTTDGSTPDDSVDIGPEGALSLDDLSDGVTVVKARAVSGAGVASDEVGSGTIRVDRTPPVLVLGRPEQGSVVATVSDATSGVESAMLERRPDSSADWTRVPSELHDGKLVARLGELPAGTYELRAAATDVAGNRSLVSTFADGGRAAVTVEPPPAETGGEVPVAATAPAQVSAPGPLANAVAAKPKPKRQPARCAAKTKRGHGRHHRGKRRPKSCVRLHRKGGEKHRHRHLGGKTHKPARGIAG